MAVAGTVAAVAAVAVMLSLAVTASAAYQEQPIALPWHPGGPVHSSVRAHGVVYLGGKLDGTGGIAAIDADTGRLIWQIASNNDVRALALSTDGKRLYAGGRFTAIAGRSVEHVAAINLARHTPVSSWDGRIRGTVRDLIVRDNTLYVAGMITKVGSVTQRGIGALNATTGMRRANFDFSADNDVLAMALTRNRLILAGSFTHIDRSARASLASINLSKHALTAWAPARLCPHCNQYFDVKTDGTNAYVAGSGNAGGAFNLTSGQQAWPIIRGDGDFQAVALPGDGKVYFGGHFGQEIWVGAKKQNVVTASVLASVFISSGRIDTSWTPKIYHTYPGCWTLTSTAGKLWVGGDFAGEQVNGKNNHEPFLAAFPART